MNTFSLLSILIRCYVQCSLKIWDVRQTRRETHKIGDSEFEAGVTAISPHPAQSHVFAAGSYDECIRIYDQRKMDRPMTKVRVGGGVWRMKWHPSCWGYETSDCGRLLVAAMHGGCRVIDIPAFDARSSNGDANDFEVLSVFTAHESMAYGADWICFGQSSDAVASCSFYDRKAFIWNPYNRNERNVH
jgi:diphthamide biosynthesis protein 7